MHHSVFFVGGDESVWGMGMRTQGRTQDQSKLNKIEIPEAMRNVKKYAHGKFFRLALTEDGRLFINGENRKYMTGSNISRETYVSKFCPWPEDNFFRIGEGDKIVDVCGGKHFTAIVTERGQVFATGYMFYRSFDQCRENS